MSTPSAEDRTAETASVGLCARCRHARVKRSARGSAFWQCGRAVLEPRFTRYPRLPVATCPGHQAGDPSE